MIENRRHKIMEKEQKAKKIYNFLRIGQYGTMYYPTQFRVGVKITKIEEDVVYGQRITMPEKGCCCHPQFFIPKGKPGTLLLINGMKEDEDPLLLMMPPKDYEILDYDLMERGGHPLLEDMLNFVVYKGNVYSADVREEDVKGGIEESKSTLKRTLYLAKEKLKSREDGNYSYYAYTDTWYWFPIIEKQMELLENSRDAKA